MKKILFLIILLIPFMIKAEQMSLDFQTEELYSVSQQNIFYKDGYLFLDSNIDINAITHIPKDTKETTISYYNKNGDCLKTKYIEHYYLQLVFSNEEDLYGFGQKDGNTDYFIFRLDEDFNIIKEFDLNTNSPFPQDSGYPMAKSFIVDNKVEFVYNDTIENKYYVIQLNKELTNFEVIPIEEYDKPEKFYIITADGELVYRVNLVEFKDNYYYIVNRDQAGCNTPKCPTYGALVKLDKNYKKVWEKVFNNYFTFNGIAVNSSNMYVLGAVGQEVGTLLVLDAEGTMVDKIEEKTAVNNVIARDDILLLNSGTVCVSYVSFVYHDYNGCQSDIRHRVYRMIYDIETKVSKGKGKVEVVPHSRKGEGITFKVSPGEGYVLGEVTVTDANGNTVKFHDYTFTMPSANVTIEAAIVKKEASIINPETKGFIASTFVSIFIISMIVIFTFYKKIKAKQIKEN